MRPWIQQFLSDPARQTQRVVEARGRSSALGVCEVDGFRVTRRDVCAVIDQPTDGFRRVSSTCDAQRCFMVPVRIAAHMHRKRQEIDIVGVGRKVYRAFERLETLQQPSVSGDAPHRSGRAIDHRQRPRIVKAEQHRFQDLVQGRHPSRKYGDTPRTVVSGPKNDRFQWAEKHFVNFIYNLPCCHV